MHSTFCSHNIIGVCYPFSSLLQVATDILNDCWSSTVYSVDLLHNVLILVKVGVAWNYMLLDIGFHLSTLSSSCYDQNCLYQCHLLQIPQILFLT